VGDAANRQHRIGVIFMGSDLDLAGWCAGSGGGKHFSGLVRSGQG
jgi:hypothetical protein